MRRARRGAAGGAGALPRPARRAVVAMSRRPPHRAHNCKRSLRPPGTHSRERRPRPCSNAWHESSTFVSARRPTMASVRACGALRVLRERVRGCAGSRSERAQRPCVRGRRRAPGVKARVQVAAAAQVAWAAGAARGCGAATTRSPCGGGAAAVRWAARAPPHRASGLPRAADGGFGAPARPTAGWWTRGVVPGGGGGGRRRQRRSLRSRPGRLLPRGPVCAARRAPRLPSVRTWPPSPPDCQRRLPWPAAACRHLAAGGGCRRARRPGGAAGAGCLVGVVWAP